MYASATSPQPPLSPRLSLRSAMRGLRRDGSRGLGLRSRRGEASWCSPAGGSRGSSRRAQGGNREVRGAVRELPSPPHHRRTGALPPSSDYAPVAQRLERATFNREVEGSSPSGGTSAALQERSCAVLLIRREHRFQQAWEAVVQVVLAEGEQTAAAFGAGSDHAALAEHAEV